MPLPNRLFRIGLRVQDLLADFEHFLLTGGEPPVPCPLYARKVERFLAWCAKREFLVESRVVAPMEAVRAEVGRLLSEPKTSLDDRALERYTFAFFEVAYARWYGVQEPLTVPLLRIPVCMKKAKQKEGLGFVVISADGKELFFPENMADCTFKLPMSVNFVAGAVFAKSLKTEVEGLRLWRGIAVHAEICQSVLNFELTLKALDLDTAYREARWQAQQAAERLGKSVCALKGVTEGELYNVGHNLTRVVGFQEKANVLGSVIERTMYKLAASEQSRVPLKYRDAVWDSLTAVECSPFIRYGCKHDLYPEMDHCDLRTTISGVYAMLRLVAALNKVRMLPSATSAGMPFLLPSMDLWEYLYTDYAKATDLGVGLRLPIKGL